MERALGLRLLDRSRNGSNRVLGRALVKRGTDGFRRTVAGSARARISFRSNRWTTADRQLRERCSRSTPGRDRSIRTAASGHSPERRANRAQHRALPRIRERSVDLLLGWVPTPFAEDDLVVELVFSDPGSWSRDEKANGHGPTSLTLADLADEAWVLPPPDTFPRFSHRRSVSRNRTEHVSQPITTLSIHLCCRLAATGHFVTLLPSSIVQFSGRDLSLKMLPINLPRKSAVSVAIVTLKNRTLNPAAEIFMNAFANSQNPWRASRCLKGHELCGRA